MKDGADVKPILADSQKSLTSCVIWSWKSMKIHWLLFYSIVYKKMLKPSGVQQNPETHCQESLRIKIIEEREGKHIIMSGAIYNSNYKQNNMITNLN